MALAGALAAGTGCGREEAAPEPAAAAPLPPPGVEALLPDELYSELQTLRAQMQDAAVGFTVGPDVLHLGDSADARLTISPSLSPNAFLQRQSPEGSGGGLLASPRMRADLTAVGASVAVLGSEEQVVSSDGDTEWRWLVEPNWEGEIPLTVTLFALVMLQGQETPYEIRSFDATLNVSVAPSQRLTLFLSSNWGWLWLLAVPPVVVLWMNRHKRRKKRRRRKPSAPIHS